MLSLGKSGAFLARSGIGVGGIADHYDTRIALCRFVQRASLSFEYFSICGEQIAPFHALGART